MWRGVVLLGVCLRLILGMLRERRWSCGVVGVCDGALSLALVVDVDLLVTMNGDELRCE